MPDRLLYSLDEAAAMLDVSPKTLLAHVRAGDIRFVLVGQGKKKQHRKFEMADLQGFIDRRKRQCEIPRPRAARASVSRSASTSTVIDYEALQKRRRTALKSKTPPQ